MEKQLCIVLRAVDYKDYDRILTLFSREQGKIGAQARGVRSLKSQLATAAQPFCCAEYEFYEKSGRLFVTNALIRQEFFHIRNDYPAYAAACVMLELTDKIIEYTDDYGRLFVTLANALFAVEAKQTDGRAALAYFLTQAADVMGIFPSTAFCTVCGRPLAHVERWAAREGGAICKMCAQEISTEAVSPKEVLLLEQIRRVSPKELAKIQASAAEIAGVIRRMDAYIGVQADFKLRSMRVFIQIL